MRTTEILKPAVFFDKDGTLVENVPYNVDCSRLKLVPHAGEALRLLHGHGFAIVVVTNQAGIARGYFSIADLRRLEAGLRRLAAAEGVPLAGFYFCPHAPDGVVREYSAECVCRKPEPGMIFAAAHIAPRFGAFLVCRRSLGRCRSGPSSGLPLRARRFRRRNSLAAILVASARYYGRQSSRCGAGNSGGGFT